MSTKYPGQGNGESETAPRRLRAAERQAKALNLRKAGATYEQIAKELGLSLAGAYQCVKAALQRTIQEPADEYRKVEIERLNTMLRAIWARVLNGDLGAIDRAVRIVDKISALLGLDAPTKVEHGGKLTLEQLVAAANQLPRIIDERVPKEAME